jgi:hypothetical protein
VNHEGQKGHGAINHAKPSKGHGKGSGEHGASDVESRKPPPNPPAGNDKQTRGERYFYLATQAALVVITGVGIAIAICSLNSLNESVLAANRQAESAASQAATAQEEFISTQRSGIVLGNDKNVLAEFTSYQNQPAVAIYYRNIGHSAANEVLPKALPETTPPATTLQYSSFAESAGTFDTGPNLAPEQWDVEYVPIDPIKAEQIQKGNLYLRIVGRIIYWDEFGDYCEPFAIYFDQSSHRFGTFKVPQTVCQSVGGEIVDIDAKGYGKIEFATPTGSIFSHYQKKR